MTEGKRSVTYGLEHVVALIHFPPKAEIGPCECSCGWVGVSASFAEHRREQRTATKHNRWVKTEGTPEWNRTINPERALAEGRAIA